MGNSCYLPVFFNHANDLFRQAPKPGQIGISMPSDTQITILEAVHSEKPILEELMQLYLHYFSEFEEVPLNESGRYDYQYLDLYWQDDDRHPFIIRVNNNIAGFVLVNKQIFMEEADSSIGEFFIVPNFRRRYIGKKAAFHIFDKFPGCWEVRQTSQNSSAQSFWQSVIHEYTDGEFRNYPHGAKGWTGPIQTFNSRKSS